MLDESDAAFKGNPEYSEALRGILNSGYRLGGKTSVCVGQGKSITYQDFSCFCPKAIAGINKLPDTVRDRSITIEMRRRAPGEHVERMRRRDIEKVSEPIRKAIEQWAVKNIKPLLGEQPKIPNVLSDRAADCWEPLLAIANLAGDAWSKKARKAAVLLSRHTVKEDDSLGIKLLTDIRNVFRNEERLFSDELCQKLIALEESPWGELPFGIRKGKPIDARLLACHLKPYNVRSKQIKKDAIGKKGYLLSDFEDVLKRYLPAVVKKRNKGNQGNYIGKLTKDDEQVSVVSDVSSITSNQKELLFPNFPLYGKEHQHEYVIIKSGSKEQSRCNHCGEFAKK